MTGDSSLFFTYLYEFEVYIYKNFIKIVIYRKNKNSFFDYIKFLGKVKKFIIKWLIVKVKKSSVVNNEFILIKN